MAARATAEPRSPDPGEQVPLRRLGAVTLWLLGRGGAAVEFTAATSPGLVAGVLEVAPPAGLIWSATAGRAWPPRSVQDVAGYTASLGRISAWFDEQTPAQVHAGVPVPRRPPTGIADVVGRVPLSPRGASTVHVEQVVDASGLRAWVVAVPGTSSWDPVPGPVPLDLTGNVHALAGRRTAAAAAVAGAMDAAGVRSGEPVLLVGHSQGGLVVAALAADPGFRQRFSVTHVVTAGAPVAGLGGPDGVRMLSIEHTDDVVPRLEGDRNPDRPSWVTATRPSTADPAIAARILHEPGLAHSLPAYVATASALDDSADPSIQAWREGFEVFVDRPGASSSARAVEVIRRPAAER